MLLQRLHRRRSLLRGLRSPFRKKPLRRTPSPPSWVRRCSASPTRPSPHRSRSLARVAMANAAGELGFVSTAGHFSGALRSMRPRRRLHRKDQRRQSSSRQPRRSLNQQHRSPQHRPAPVKSSRRFRAPAQERATFRRLRRRSSGAKLLTRLWLRAQPDPLPFTARGRRVRPRRAIRQPRASLDRRRAPSPRPPRPRS